MQVAGRILLLFLVFCLHSSFVLNEKESTLAQTSLSWTSNTITKIKQQVTSCNDFADANKDKDQANISFSKIEIEMKSLDKHISKGVKIAAKLIKLLDKRKVEMDKSTVSLIDDLYYYHRGQEDFYECQGHLEDAVELKDCHELYGLSSRMNKALWYIQQYKITLNKLLELK